MKKILSAILLMGLVSGFVVPGFVSAVCGDYTIDAGELCDGNNVGGKTCTEMLGTTATGNVVCSLDCQSYDTSACVIATGGTGGTGGVTSTGGSAGDAPDVDVIAALHSIVNWAFAILIIVAGMMLIFAAFTYLTASGDPDKVKKAHDAVLWALVGVAVAVMAKGLVTLVDKIVNV